MDPQTAIDLGQQAIVTALWIAAPILLTGLAVGLVIGLLQAMTQIQEQSVATIPKLMLMALAASLALPWLLAQMMAYTEGVLRNIGQMF